MLKSRAILIVEDELLMGHSLADAVGDLGGDPIGPFSTVKEAIEALDCVTVSGAILDAELQDGQVTPVAMRLASRAIPIVVHSGTGMPREMADQWPLIPCVSKPAPATEVVELLCAEMDKATGCRDCAD